jgi:AhpD family alkylhydroperoxidase
MTPREPAIRSQIRGDFAATPSHGRLVRASYNAPEHRQQKAKEKMSHARKEYRDFMSLTPDAYEAVLALSQVAGKAGMDKQLLELIKLRASQINGCAFCVQYHILESEKLGVPADKLNLVVVWREAPLFSPRERAALAWTEALTLLADGVSDEVYAEASAEFSDKELAYLTSAVASINVWNRFGAAFRWTPPARKTAVGAAAS